MLAWRKVGRDPKHKVDRIRDNQSNECIPHEYARPVTKLPWRSSHYYIPFAICSSPLSGICRPESRWGHWIVSDGVIAWPSTVEPRTALKASRCHYHVGVRVLFPHFPQSLYSCYINEVDLGDCWFRLILALLNEPFVAFILHNIG